MDGLQYRGKNVKKYQTGLSFERLLRERSTSGIEGFAHLNMEFPDWKVGCQQFNKVLWIAFLDNIWNKIGSYHTIK